MSDTPALVLDLDLPLDLEPIRKRCRAALRKPWRVALPQVDTKFYIAAPPPPDRDWSGDHVGYAFREADAEFIAHARQDIPALIAEVERLRGLLETKDANEPDEVVGFVTGASSGRGNP